MNHNIRILAHTRENPAWKTDNSAFTVPGKIIFKLDTETLNYTDVKKVGWYFGDETKVQIITNRKNDPLGDEVEHTFRAKRIQPTNETLSIQASVYTETTMYITSAFKVIVKENSHKNYVDPIIFRDQIELYYITNEMPDALAMSVYQIANRLAFAPNFLNYSYREEMVGDALIKMYEALNSHKFKSEKGNPFSYFTKIAFHAFCNRIKKEKRIRQALTLYQEEVYDTLIGEGILPATHGHCSHEGDSNDTNAED